MFGGKKKAKKTARTQSVTERDFGPALPPRPPGGLRQRSSISFDTNSSSSSPLTSSLSPSFSPSSFPVEPGVLSEMETPPPIPISPRPKLHISRSVPDDSPPPLPPHPPPGHPHQPSRATARNPGPPLPSPPNGTSLPPLPSSPSSLDSRYIKRSGNAPPSISSSSLVTEEQLRSLIDLQTQNTEELIKLLKGKEEDAMTPSNLVTNYGRFFPFKAMVMKGFYNNRAEIVAGEVYNIHFLKNAKVISIIDSSGEMYVLPLNAAMRMGFEQPGQPPVYYNIVDIINSTHPPKLICPREDYKGSEGNSLKQDEVLIVKGVHVTKLKRAKALVVVNIATMQEKKIPSDCIITFSTEPTYNQLTLIDLAEKVPELIPGIARLYPTVDVEDIGFPGHLVSEVVKVKRQYQERSLITTLEEQEPRPVDRFSLSTEPEIHTKTIYDIPLSLDIEFSILPPQPEEDLYAYTHQLSQQFDPRKLQSGDGLGLNMAIDEDNIYSGVELELPPYMNYDPSHPTFIPPKAAVSPPPPLPTRKPPTSAQSDSDGEEYTEIDNTKFKPIPSSPSHAPPPLPSSHPPPLSSSLPPPLPSSNPPPLSPSHPLTSSRPTSASSKSSSTAHAPLPPIVSPKPARREGPPASIDPSQITPPAPNSEVKEPKFTKATSVDDYEDMTKLESNLQPPLTPPHPSTTQQPPMAAAHPIHPATLGVGGREESPASSVGSAYEDTADLGISARPRLPSPVNVVSDSTDEDQEILQQFTDLHRVVQSARSIMKTKQQLSSPAHSTTSELKRLKEDLKRVGPLPQKIVNYLMVVERELATLSDIVREELVKASSSEVLQQNREFVATLSVAQVVKMLEMLNMRQYQDRFAEEGIDGVVFCDLEETVLETSLGVKRKLDRIKLMKIIKGERSAKSVLEGQYNYVALQPLS